MCILLNKKKGLGILQVLPKASLAIDFLFIIGGNFESAVVYRENSVCDSRWLKSEIQFGIQFRRVGLFP